jgi:nucleoside-diphosphate-sugar epimerase
MRVFLTGATGYIGSAVADALLASGDQVIGLARTDEAVQKLTGKSIDVQRGDLTDLKSLVSGAKEADAVIHTATTNDGSRDRAAVEAILGALAGTGKPFIYTSGVWVLGDTDGKLADEDTPVNPPAFLSWRADLEEDVLAAAKDNVRCIVIRPAMVYGGGGGLFTGFIESAKKDGAQYIGGGENRWTGVHVEDLADLYALALHNAPAGTLLHGANGDAVRVRHIADAANRAVGAGPCLSPLTLEEARKTMGPMADALTMDQRISGTRARRVLGWSPHRPELLDDIENGSYRPVG